MTETNDPGYPQYGGWTQPPANPPQPGEYQPGQYQPGQYQPGQYQPGQYQPGQYQPGQYQPGATYPPAPPNTGDRLGARSRRRPTPRFSIAVAGAGAALVLAGASVWAGGYYVDGIRFITFSDDGLGGGGGSSRRFLGVVLFLGLAAAGYTMAIARRRGPVATAGAVAAAFGVPLMLGFLTLDMTHTLRGDYPFNVDAVFLVSIAAWLVDYFLVPGLRGRSLFLGAAALAFFAYVALKVSGGDSITSPSSLAFGTGGSDAGAVTAAGLVFGLTYYAIAIVLDRQGRPGAAVALVVAGFYATAAGILAGANDMGLAGTGALLVFLGAGLSCYGAYFGRRFTAWVWAAGLALGAGLIIAKIFPDSYVHAGISLMIVGVLVVVAAYAIATATSEAPDVEEAPAPAGAVGG